MIATIGFILAIGLLVYMIIRGIDMITATVVTAAVCLASWFWKPGLRPGSQRH